MRTLIIAYTAMLAGYLLIALTASAFYALMGNSFKYGIKAFVPGFIGLIVNYTGCVIALYALGLIR